MRRDYDSAPVSAQLGLAAVIAGLVSDLDDLRAGKISVSDAVARSMLAKQIFNGVRIYLNGTKALGLPRPGPDPEDVTQHGSTCRGSADTPSGVPATEPKTSQVSHSLHQGETHDA